MLIMMTSQILKQNYKNSFKLIKEKVTYSLLSTTGPANAPEFEVAVMMDDMTLGTGKGSSKKRAEQKAAKDALKKLAK